MTPSSRTKSTTPSARIASQTLHAASKFHVDNSGTLVSPRRAASSRYRCRSSDIYHSLSESGAKPAAMPWAQFVPSQFTPCSARRAPVSVERKALLPTQSTTSSNSAKVSLRASLGRTCSFTLGTRSQMPVHFTARCSAGTPRGTRVRHLRSLERSARQGRLLLNFGTADQRAEDPPRCADKPRLPKRRLATVSVGGSQTPLNHRGDQWLRLRPCMRRCSSRQND